MWQALPSAAAPATAAGLPPVPLAASTPLAPSPPPPAGGDGLPAISGVLCLTAASGLRQRRRGHIASRLRGCHVAMAAAEGEAAQELALWRQAYEAEEERRERLLGKAPGLVAPEAVERPGEAAEAGAWQRAYEALRDGNAALEKELRAVPVKAEEGAEEAQPVQEAQPVEEAPPVQKAAAPAVARPGREEELMPKVLSILDLVMLPVDAGRLADVGKFRDVLGPGVLPLLSALFDGRASEEEFPSFRAVREALSLAGSRFQPAGSIDLGSRCFLLRGELDLEKGDEGGWPARAFLEERQEALDRAFGEGKLTAFLQRERYPPSIGLNQVPVGKFEASPESCNAVLMVFLTADLPIPEKSDALRRLAVGASGAVTLAFCNTVFVAVSFLEEAGGEALAQRSVEQASYSPSLGLAVTELDPTGVLPIGLSLLLLLYAQDSARSMAAEASGGKLRGGFWLPNSSVGSLGRTWSFEGLAPSRRVELDVCLAGGLAGLATSLLLCTVGAALGNGPEALLRVDVTRLPLLLANSLGDAFPLDYNLNVLGLQSGTPEATSRMVPLNAWTMGGSLCLTSLAIQLLPLRGLDGEVLARQVLGPRPTLLLEVVTGVVLVCGAANRLGPNANPIICASALLAWATYFLAAQESPMPPREDLEDEADLPGTALSALLLAVSAAVLIPGKLVPYGLLQANIL